MNNNSYDPLLLAEIKGWLRCHCETFNVQYTNYIATLHRFILGEQYGQDFITMNQLRSHLINCSNVPRSQSELRALLRYIDGIEREAIYKTPVTKREVATQ